LGKATVRNDEEMNQKRKKLLLQIGNVIVPILCFALIGFSNLDFSTVFSDSAYPNLINPAPITFAIWGPIFFFQFLFYFYQARDLFKSPENKIEMPYVHEVSVFFMLSWISTTIWYILWANGYVWPAIAAMYAYLLTSLGAYFRLEINRRERSLREHVFVTVGWSMLSGWVTVATVVNTTTGFVSLGFNAAPIGEAGWSILILSIVLTIYLLVLFTRNDYVFAGVGLWATIGVLIERIDPLNPPQPEIALVCSIGTILLTLIIIIRLIVQYKSGDLQFLRRTS
jgi:translocator protein